MTSIKDILVSYFTSAPRQFPGFSGYMIRTESLGHRVGGNGSHPDRYIYWIDLTRNGITSTAFPSATRLKAHEAYTFGGGMEHPEEYYPPQLVLTAGYTTVYEQTFQTDAKLLQELETHLNHCFPKSDAAARAAEREQLWKQQETRQKEGIQALCRGLWSPRDLNDIVAGTVTKLLDKKLQWQDDINAPLADRNVFELPIDATAVADLIIADITTGIRGLLISNVRAHKERAELRASRGVFASPGGCLEDDIITRLDALISTSGAPD
jgi:hypothetical protein